MKANPASTATASKFVASTDGTLIGYEQCGSGPNLLLVHGTATIRAQWASIFEQHFTVTVMDRRGRGGSGDSSDYAIEREFEDVAAMVNALDAPVLLFGHSYGGLCALGSAMLTDKLAGLILYEPALSDGEALYSLAQLAQLETFLAAGDHEGLVRTFLGGVVGMPPHEVELLASSQAWPNRVATAPTIPREMRAEQTYRIPVDSLGRLNIPVLLLSGGDSPPDLGAGMAKLENILPNSRTVTMPGQQHIAMYTAPDLLVGAVLDFWRDIGSR
jgi:pimeloyl-ACP methyl ester carboxylesterase